MTAPDRATLRRLYIDQGLSGNDIAVMFGVPKTTAYDWLRRNGVRRGTSRRGRHHHMTAIDDADVRLIWALKGSMTAAECAAKFDCSADVIRNIWLQRTWGWLTARLGENG